MEANKDEALRLVDQARGLLDTSSSTAGDHEVNVARATKCLKKAQRLYHTKEADVLLGRCRRMGQGGRVGREGGQASVAQDEECAEDSKEQLDKVRRIMQSRNHYEVLDVSHDVTDIELKRVYKRLALQFHPDKNKTRGATEAFKTIGAAFDVLSDPQKRSNYDRCLANGTLNNRAANHHYQTYSNGSAQFYTETGDVTVEDLLNMFFGGGSAYSPTERSRHRGSSGAPRTDTSRQQHGNSHTTTLVLQMLPILMLLLLTLVSNIFYSQEPLYSFERSADHPVMRRTSQHQVIYYVSAAFASSEFVAPPGARSGDVVKANRLLQQLESRVEREYVHALHSKCRLESSARDQKIWHARMFGTQESVKRAQSMTRPSCDELARLGTFSI